MSNASSGTAVAAAVLSLSLHASPVLAQLQSRVYVSGLNQPVAFVQDPSDAAVQYVVELGGRIRVVQSGVVRPADFLNLGGAISTGGERGLLGLAFPADYAASGRFFVNFTDPAGHTVVARFRRSAGDRLIADLASRFDLRWPSGQRVIEQPFANHNGGNLVFGPDGHLYIGMGDGGSANDPEHLAQNPLSLLGKMLRIDVSVPDTDPNGYRVPPDNPFLDGNPVAALGEIWAFGLRNPWRFSFDDPAREGTGALLIGDVGQGAWEEIDYEPAGRGGRNYGWRNREGAHPNVTSLPPAYLPLVDPVFEYDHTVGRSVTGGFVYRGVGLGPRYRGRYFYADFISGRVWSLGFEIDPATGEASFVDRLEHTAELGGSGTLGNISSFGVDASGELYVASLSAGAVFRVGVADADGDGLPDWWETGLGLDAGSAAGANGGTGDPDGDGRTNLQEYQDGTHPRGFYTRYFAEGATGTLFDYWLAILNPANTVAHVNLRFMQPAGAPVSHQISVPAMSRRTVVAKQVPGLAYATAVSTVVESDVQIVADRTMSWDGNAYGAHAETSIANPATTWYLAEGATHSGFDLFYLIQNPNTADVTVRVTYLRPAPLPPIVKEYAVAANSRYNIWVDLEEFPAGSGNRALAQTDVSAILQSHNSSRPIIVERAMYLSLGQEGQPGYQFFGAGHDSAGVTAPALEWFLAEGATGSYFNLYYLLANPNAADAAVTVTYMPEGAAAFTKSYTVRANSRQTIFVNAEDARVANASVSARVTVANNVPVIVERAMWWPGPTWATWFEAHNSPGALETGTKWAVADVEHSGVRGTETYILIANTSNFAGQAKVTLVFEDGSAPQELPLVDLPANSRTTTYWLKTGGERQRFSVIVESVGTTPAQIVVERAMYWDALGVHWAAGTNALGTKLQ